jgi:hypothetical protein
VRATAAGPGALLRYTNVTDTDTRDRFVAQVRRTHHTAADWDALLHFAHRTHVLIERRSDIIRSIIDGQLTALVGLANTVTALERAGGPGAVADTNLRDALNIILNTTTTSGHTTYTDAITTLIGGSR